MLKWFLILGLLATSSAHAKRLDGFRSLSDTSWGYAITKDIVRAGKRAQRFEVRPGDCGEDPGWSDCDNNRERSEISLKKRWRYGQTQWIGFSVYLPKDFKTSSRVATTVGQIHQKGGPKGTAGGLPSFPPLMQLEMRGNQYVAGVHILTGSANNVRDVTREIPLTTVSKMRGTWTDIMIGLQTQKNGSDVLQVYVNGVPKVQIADFINFRPKEFYFKYGIYRSFVSRHGGPMPTQILYIDEVRMGRSRDKVEVNQKRAVD